MLRLLGQPRHEGSGFFPSRGYLLIGALTFAPGRVMSRERLAALLWERSTPSHALANLRYVISQIRKWGAVNGRCLLAVTASHVGLAAAPLSDVDRLLQLHSLDKIEELQEFLDLWAGEFLEAEDLQGADLDNWFRSARERLTRRAISLGLDAAANIGGRPCDELLERLVRVAPYDEEIIRAHLLNLVSIGRTEDATAFYRDFRRRLQIEMQAEVEPETRVLASQLLPRIGQVEQHMSSVSAQPGAVSRKDVRATRSGLPRLLILPPSASSHSSLASAVTFARTLVTDLTLYLGKMRTFAVIAPFTARRVDAVDPLAAAARINAGYVVTVGILSTSPNALLAFALMDSDTGEILLTDTLPIAANRLERTEAELAEALATAIAKRISGSELLKFHQTGEASAFAHYLLGTERLRYDLPAIRKARKHFQRAMELAPNFSPAIAMLARALNYEWLVLGRSDSDLLHAALDLAMKAAELDPLNPVGHWEIGHSLLYLRRLDESLNHIADARQRAPHLADLLADEADVLVHLGQFKTALRAIDQATELNPIVPDEYLWVRGSTLYFLGDYGLALGTLRSMRDTGPVARLIAASAAMAGEPEVAATFRDKWLERYPGFQLADWTRQIPLKDRGTQEQMMEGMLRAGFR